jgi:hypothetical protein
MNACLATLLIVALPQRAQHDTTHEPRTARDEHQVAWPSLAKTLLWGLVALTVLVSVYGYLTLAMYQQHLEGKPWANHSRFGPEAKWRISPILKHGKHP